MSTYAQTRRLMQQQQEAPAPAALAAPEASPATGQRIRVRNMAASDVQTTAEHIVRQANELAERPDMPIAQKLDAQGNAELRATKRRQFEDSIQMDRGNLKRWLSYARWEATQKQFDRARSIFERTLEHEYRNPKVWLAYTKMEMQNRFVNMARNVFERAVTLLPRHDELWLKFAAMEETLGQLAHCRAVFDRWMNWHPDIKAWKAYVNMEIRNHHPEHARAVYQRLVVAHPDLASYLAFAKFEAKQGGPHAAPRARAIYERAADEVDPADVDARLYSAFATFEKRQGEYERARAIYRFGLEQVPKHKAERLYQEYSAFEKQHGTRQGVEDAIHSKRRLEYEAKVKEDPFDYDAWFDYARLEEAKVADAMREGAVSPMGLARVRDVYEAAITHVPLNTQEKLYWKRYIYLWIQYAVFEEVVAGDVGRARAVYRKCLDLIPHRVFTFCKLWVMLSHLEVRCKDLGAARKVMGTALGRCPKASLFEAYIALETRLGEMDRCRMLYQKYLEFGPENCVAWMRFAALEAGLQEVERARAVYELAVQQPVLDTPELLWKAYIDYETQQGADDRVRALYRRLLELTSHAKVWMSWGEFESTRDVAQARTVFAEADALCKRAIAEAEDEEAAAGEKEHRAMVLQKWLDVESAHGDVARIAAVQGMQPDKVKKRRQVTNARGEAIGWEEYFDYLFPDTEAEKQKGGLKILEMARKWKRQKQ